MQAKTLAFAVALATAVGAHAADGAAADNINNYLVDITGGAVAAANLVGVDKSAITQIQTSQDIVVALQPLTSGDPKSGFGFAITPARTTLLPMSGGTYVGSPFARLLGNLTLSYAQNAQEVEKISYRKTAFSVDTVYYFDLEDDPIRIGNKAFKVCADRDKDRDAKDIDAIARNDQLSKEAKQAALQALTDKLDESVSACIDAELKEKARWNAGRASLSFGEGRIKAPGATARSLGRSLTLNAQFPATPRGVVAVSLRRTRNALDPATVAAVSPVIKNASLAAARFTYGDQDDTNLRALVEASNSKSSSADAFKDTFMFAFGLDKRIAQGAWLELRIGRNRSLENGKEQTTALMNISISPTLFDFKK